MSNIRMHTMIEERIKQLRAFEKSISISFNDLNLLNQALTHRSYANEFKENKVPDNENLEFLGDAILGLVISEYIYRKFPHYNEGDLSKLKSVIVSRRLLADYGQEINIGNFLLLGKGEKITGGSGRESIIANSVEALIGALYLDSNLDIVRNFVISQLRGRTELICDEKFQKDYKSILQEYTQSKYKQKPLYEVIQEKGPDHIKEFKIQVSVNQIIYGVGDGRSKKEAEQNAAYFALINFKAIDL